MVEQIREIAETYIGNITKDTNLEQRVKSARSLNNYLEIYLSQTDSCKGRIQAQSTSGIIVGIIKNRDWSLSEGDVFITKSNKLLLIHLQEQKLMVLSFTEPVENYAIELLHLGHVLGNHHWPIIVNKNKIYIQLVADAEIIEDTINKFKIPGLKIDYEFRSAQEHFHFSQHNHHG
ncbi:urease accessory protein UreE [Okeania sp.]|uniref:urease accessory protein UreE n=1 Tax=Okeania sp. TaxID=3100323 RepID=UPI002B4B4263|nr:urease accessory protein UreE [Okeania sp.]MEB3339902.1 urease accessory protein UreE [Okeania sp.]